MDLGQLKIPQVRVLMALQSGAVLTRAKMATRAGYSELSGTVTRVLHGLRAGSSSGAAHDGVLAMGLVERVDLDVDGLVEEAYVITDAGLDALEAWLEEHGPPPKQREKKSCINKRYQ